MISIPVAHLLEQLGVTKSLSRPYTSDDNPYSEAHFKTMKYRPDYPDRFADYDAARTWVRTFVAWYNFDHLHSGIGFVTPAACHFGQDQQIFNQRQAVLDQAFANYPQRFVNGPPQPPVLPTEVWINKPTTTDDTSRDTPFLDSEARAYQRLDDDLTSERVDTWAAVLQ